MILISMNKEEDRKNEISHECIVARCMKSIIHSFLGLLPSSVGRCQQTKIISFSNCKTERYDHYVGLLSRR